MAQQYPPNAYQSGTYAASSPLMHGQQFSVLVFLRGLATPVVLYAENPPQVFEEIKGIIRQADPKAPKLIEKTGNGPLKKVAFLDIEVTGVALQGDPTLGSPR